MPTRRKGQRRQDGCDCTHCHPGHKRWADLFWGVLEFMRLYDPSAHRALCATFGLASEGRPRPVPGLFAVHPSPETLEWAERFRKRPEVHGTVYRQGEDGREKIQLEKGRRSDDPTLEELMVHGVVMWHLGRCSKDREDPTLRAHDLQEQWPALLKDIPRSIGGERLPRRRDTPDFNEMVADGPTHKRLAIRLAAHILGYPERTTENRLTAARRRYPDRAKIFKLWRATGLKMIKSS